MSGYSKRFWKFWVTFEILKRKNSRKRRMKKQYLLVQIVVSSTLMEEMLVLLHQDFLVTARIFNELKEYFTDRAEILKLGLITA